MLNNANSTNEQSKFDSSVGQSPKRNSRRLVTIPRTTYIQDVRARSTPVKVASNINVIAKPALVTQKPVYTTTPIKTKRKTEKLQIATVTLGVGMLLAGGYISLVGWHNAKIAQVQAAQLTAQTNGDTGRDKVLITKPPATRVID